MIWSENEINLLTNNYGLVSVEELSNILLHPRSSVVHKAKSLGLKFTDKIKSKTIEMYKSGRSALEISELLNVSIAKVFYDLKDVEKKIRKYKFDFSYFDNIDNQKKAYILGFLYADGNNDMKRGRITIGLHRKDREILEKISNTIYGKDYVKNRKYGRRQISTLVFHSRKFSETLFTHGCINRKSLVLQYPMHLDDTLFFHFIRGYFDGDGCICGRKQLKFSLVSTKDFLDIVKHKIENKLNIHCSESVCYNKKTWTLTVHGNKQVKKLLDFIYEDASLYLERKHTRYINHFKLGETNAWIYKDKK